MNKIVIKEITIRKLQIPFRNAFSHAQATRKQSDSILVVAKSEKGNLGHGESAPRTYVTSEDIESAILFFHQYKTIFSSITCIADLKAIHLQLANEIDKNPAAWCAIEIAILDLISRENNMTVETLLELPKLSGSFKYSAILDSSSLETFNIIFKQYRAQGFLDYKLKLSGNIEKDKTKLTILQDINNQNLRIRVDANNLWNTHEEAIRYLKSLRYNFYAIEEPLKPNDLIGMRKIAQALKTNIILDESFINKKQFGKIKNEFFWIVNLRISKMGGLLRSVNIAELAIQHSTPLIIGAQVGETSILTRAALTVANAFRKNIIAQEGGFGTKLLKYDIVDPELSFNTFGEIHASGISKYLHIKDEYNKC